MYENPIFLLFTIRFAPQSRKAVSSYNEHKTIKIKKRGGLCLFHTSLASEKRVKLLQSAISRSLLEAEEEENFANYW